MTTTRIRTQKWVKLKPSPRYSPQHYLLSVTHVLLLMLRPLKRFSFISYILLLKNLDYGRNNKCYIIIIYILGGDINYISGGAKFLNTGLFKVKNYYLLIRL
jgi:hypothetical protein